MSFQNKRQVQKVTLGFMNTAIESENDLDMMVANLLHRMWDIGSNILYNDRKLNHLYVGFHK